MEQITRYREVYLCSSHTSDSGKLRYRSTCSSKLFFDGSDLASLIEVAHVSITANLSKCLDRVLVACAKPISVTACSAQLSRQTLTPAYQLISHSPYSPRRDGIQSVEFNGSS